MAFNRRAELRMATNEIVRALCFAALMMATPAIVKFLPLFDSADEQIWARRMTMVLVGLFFADMGNRIPKTLTPLSELSCDAAKVQAFQRYFGRVWVMTGLMYAAVWLVLPLDIAQPIALLVLGIGIFAVAAQMVRRLTPHRR